MPSGHWGVTEATLDANDSRTSELFVAWAYASNHASAWSNDWKAMFDARTRLDAYYDLSASQWRTFCVGMSDEGLALPDGCAPALSRIFSA
jgi:hypothetical protein